MKTRSLDVAAAIAGAMLGAGCGPAGSPALERTGDVALAIEGGYLDGDDTAVVAFYHVAAGSLCSGSLIAPNVVLTARHCVSETLNTVNDGVVCSKTSFGPPGSPLGFLVTTSAEITLSNAGEHLVAEVVALPEDATGDAFCGNDMAILILKENVDASVAAPYSPRVDAPLIVGEPYSAIGYGATSDGGAGAGYRRRRDGLSIACVTGGCPSFSVGLTEWTGEAGVCSGDSGGPAIDAGGRVIGVASRGIAGCENPVYGDTNGWSQWLKDTVARASGLGAYPAPGWTEGASVDPEHWVPIGEDCASGADCFTGRCVTSGGPSYCTRACSAEGPCPEGYTCEPDGPGEPSVCKEPAPPGPKVDPSPAGDSSCAAGRPGSGAGPGALPALAIALAAATRRRRAYWRSSLKA